MAQLPCTGLRTAINTCRKADCMQLLNFLTKRSSCVLTNSKCHTGEHRKDSRGQNEHYSTQSTNAAIKAYHKQGLNGFVYHLTPEEREELLQVLSRAANVCETTTTVLKPTRSQLRYVALFSGIPFIAFGILDNTIMLTAGEYIDITFGAWLGITTMAAAAFGNMVSDVLGIMTAGFVEQVALNFGLSAPTVTLEQMSLRQTKVMANLGRCIGVCIGCIIGMWPLLVFSKERSDCTEKDDSNTSEQRGS